MTDKADENIRQRNEENTARLAADLKALRNVLVEVEDCLDAGEPELARKIIRLRGHR